MVWLMKYVSPSAVVAISQPSGNGPNEPGLTLPLGFAEMETNEIWSEWTGLTLPLGFAEIERNEIWSELSPQLRFLSSVIREETRPVDLKPDKSLSTYSLLI